MPEILVVDDSSTDRRIAGGLLERQGGWRVSYACDGQEALERLESDPPDLILTDLQMPEMNGLELVEAVRRQFPLIPVILMTAQGSERIAVEALESGAASYVPKHELSDDLVLVVDRVLAISGEQQTRRALLERMRSLQANFVLSNDPALLTTAVAYLQGLIQDMGLLGESERLRVGVALEEALLNASYHGNLEVDSKLREENHSAYYDLARERAGILPYSDRSIYVDVDLGEDRIRYVVRDEGPGFDPHLLPDPTDPINVDRPCGRGLLLMRTFMDLIDFNEDGNEVTMIKYVAARPVLAVAT
ncbi:MAG: response regulator [Planctomycetota bacterium]|nr:MAG: response regulator [Planctomycetota bacterium]REJ97286.1 MAG: response regulator [Planctomycetota bacterium]REK21223.1 MAG: response regulator [Planctomycetota bacterium]REK29617.1 MAG: response regulator [Planctomycetota bacterium]